MHAMLFAAGRGTRLAPLTDERPKPVVPMANRPLAWFAMGHLARAGVTRIVANVHHGADEAEAGLRAAAPDGVELVVLREERLLGTGGGLSNAWAELHAGAAADAPIVVMNSDIVFAPDLARALETHARLGAVATMVLRPDADVARYGAVEIDGAGRVRRLLGRPVDVAATLGPRGAEARGGDALRAMMFTGVHVLAPDAVRELPALGCIVRHAYRRWVDEGRVVAGVVDDSPWRDVGRLRTYRDANLELASGALAWPGIEPGTAPRGSLVHPTAVLGPGALVEHSVIGAGARVAARATVRRSVVWDGATVDRDIADAIVTPTRRVPL